MRVQVKARNRAYQFEAGPREKLLFAGLRNEIELPYECASGTCGTCKAKLVEGSVDDAWPAAPGGKYLKREQGEFLMCQCVPRTDVRVEIGNFVYAMDPGARPPGSYAGTIRNARALTPEVMALQVALDRPCDFDAGQFMAMSAPQVPGYRGYSMVNFDRHALALDFVVRKKPGGGVSEWLFGGGCDGAQVQLFGPLGHATFFPGVAKHILCIAGGSGIAGMMSIVSRGCQEHYFDQFHGRVFFGVRSMRDAFFLDELAGLQSQCPERLKITVAFSDEDVPDAARLAHPRLQFERGLVHEVAARRMQGGFQNFRAYVAGPPPAVEAAIRMLLLEARLTADNIRYDKFS